MGALFLYSFFSVSFFAGAFFMGPPFFMFLFLCVILSEAEGPPDVWNQSGAMTQDDIQPLAAGAWLAALRMIQWGEGKTGTGTDFQLNRNWTERTLGGW